MAPHVPVHVGDLIEYSAGGAGGQNASVLGRVMEVEGSSLPRCLIQVSPYDPFREIDLADGDYKLVYGAGEMTKVASSMVGWRLEFTGNEGDCGVIKQVDCELNCALVAFDDGRKDWRDLSMNAFKVVGKRGESPLKSAIQQERPRPDKPLEADAVKAVSLSIAPPDADDFEWYTEGGHVELCDSGGVFIEGALLCSHGEGTVQLYNEQRGFFEIDVATHSFKVVIHGLASLKTVPLGQALEIYSPMHGEFRTGTVLKTANLGRLTPIRFNHPIGIEWVDLDHQTFKLLFLLTVEKHTGDTAGGQSATALSTADPTSKSDERSLPESPSRPASSPKDNYGKHRRHQLPIPPLCIGQVVEIMDPASKQFLKYKVIRLLQHRPHCYDVERGSGNGSSYGGFHWSSNGSVPMTINLAETKARVQVTADHWTEYRSILTGHRVDVYVRSDRSVHTGKVVECSADGEPPRVHVKLKDGSRHWYDITYTKIKLKLLGEAPVTDTVTTQTQLELSPPTQLWHRVEHATAAAEAVEQPDKPLVRQHSEKMGRVVSTSLARHVSSPGMLHNVEQPRIPALDFSGLRFNRAAAASPIAPPTSDSMLAQAGTETRRSEGDALGDMLPPMDDVYTEVRASDGDATEPKKFVRLSTGETTTHVPQWLRQREASSGEWCIVNTVTGVRFHLPGASSSSVTPLSSDRRQVVTLPVGPLEAARVASQISASHPPTELCAQAFGD